MFTVHTTCGLLLVTSIAIISAYSNGGRLVLPACSDMTPQHYPYVPQTNTAPYKIVLDTNSYSNGSTVTVTINSLSGATFRGFMIQMRKSANDDMSVVPGFTLPIIGPSAALVECQGRNGSAIVHNEGSDKVNISLKWTPAADTTGDIQAVATVVHNETTFWTMITSQTISGPPSRSTATTVNRVYALMAVVCIFTCINI